MPTRRSYACVELILVVHACVHVVELIIVSHACVHACVELISVVHACVELIIVVQACFDCSNHILC